MNPDDELDVLREQTLSLQKAIGDIDHEIGYRLPLMNTAADPDGTVSFLRDRYEMRGQHLFTLGKVAAQIEELERLVRAGQEYVPMEPDPVMDRLDSRADGTTDSDLGLLERRENRLDWLELEKERPKSPSVQGEWQEPERDRS